MASRRQRLASRPGLDEFIENSVQHGYSGAERKWVVLDSALKEVDEGKRLFFRPVDQRLWGDAGGAWKLRVGVATLTVRASRPQPFDARGWAAQEPRKSAVVAVWRLHGGSGSGLVAAL